MAIIIDFSVLLVIVDKNGTCVHFFIRQTERTNRQTSNLGIEEFDDRKDIRYFRLEMIVNCFCRSFWPLDIVGRKIRRINLLLGKLLQQF